MNRILVVYFSLTGNTRQLARRIAEACGGQLEEIRETRPREGAFGTLRCAFEAVVKRSAAVAPADYPPSDHDLVVIGGPVWVGNLSSPVRGYLERHADGFRNVAFFCTEGASGGERALAQMGVLTGRDPVATLIVTESELQSGAFEAPLERFTSALSAFRDPPEDDEA